MTGGQLLLGFVIVWWVVALVWAGRLELLDRRKAADERRWQDCRGVLDRMDDGEVRTPFRVR